MDTGVVLGTVFVLYGVFKVCVSTLALSLPSKVQAHMHGSPLRILFPNDFSASGRTVDILLFIYAIYSILHGLGLIGVNLPGVLGLIKTDLFKTCLYVSLGLTLVIFYTLVLVPEVPISKKQGEEGMYKFYVVVGVMFLLTAMMIPYYGKWI